MGKLLVGWAEESLVPKQKVRLFGQFYERISEYTETPVTATAMAVDNGEDYVVFCSCDLEGVYEPLMKSIRENLEDIEGFDPQKTLISATHSHTSVQYDLGDSDSDSLTVLRRYLPSDRDYQEKVTASDDVISDSDALVFLASKIASAIRKAWETRRPAYMANAFGRAAVGMNRRVCYSDGTAKMWGDSNTPTFVSLEGGNDSGIELLYTFDDEKHITGIVANISCPAQILEQRSFISSDYWGKVKHLLRETFGAGIFVLGLCAPAGDQCPRDLVRWVEPETPIDDPNVVRIEPPKRKADPSMYDIKGSWTVGRRIATEIEAIFDEIDPDELYCDIPLEHKVIPFDLPIRRVTKEDRDIAEKSISDYIANSNKQVFDFADSAAMHVYAGTMARYEQQQIQSVHKTEIHVIRMGQLAFASSPFELFLDFANQIRARSVAEQTFLIQLACGNDGYLPTEKAEKGGHYSAYVSSGIVGHEGGNMLVELSLDKIKEMFAEE